MPMNSAGNQRCQKCDRNRSGTAGSRLLPEIGATVQQNTSKRHLACTSAIACIQTISAMPPSRALPGQSTDQQQQQKRLISVVQKLFVLGKLNGVKGFAEAHDWADHLPSCIYAVVKGPIKDIFGASSGRKLLESLFHALSNGLRQLCLSWPQNAHHGADPKYSPTFLTALSTVHHLFRAALPCRLSTWWKDNGKSVELSIANEAGKS